ncbi:hypothetical protein EJB05_49877 [Eragrostis curvula]|uniref:Uncharacterized protein n=1 Tax=Eragrostis curvula TaxID=38414 RepID=A0A5J9T5H9_9POAL|nr:hypothetical protein EJB05_49877 [Eragrostis curvula]
MQVMSPATSARDYSVAATRVQDCVSLFGCELFFWNLRHHSYGVLVTDMHVPQDHQPGLPKVLENPSPSMVIEPRKHCGLEEHQLEDTE